MSLGILFIIFFSLVISSRILFSKKYRIYYMITAFISARLWFALLATLYYASDTIYMDELQSYSTPSENIIYIIYIMGILYLILELFAANYLHAIYTDSKKLLSENFYTKQLPLIVIVFLLINIFLFTEAFLVYDPIYNNKMVFVESTHFPFLYKALDQLNILVLMIVGYAIIVNKILRKNTKIIYVLIMLGFIIFTVKYLYLNIKTQYITNILLYLIVPNYILLLRYNIKFIKNKLFTYLLIFLTISTIMFTFSYQYGDSFITKMLNRVAWEGQLLYSSLDYFSNVSESNLFIEHIPNNTDTRAMVYTMELFAPNNKLQQFYNTGWQMSSAMPAYNFLFEDFMIANLYWIMNWILLIYLLALGLKRFLIGSIFTSFIYFNISFLVGFYYLILGNNYLFSYRFWILLVLLIFIELISKISHQKKLTTSQGII